jgi:cyclopropane fatty-acyl-phospholipid synthase-like methyltransferase
MKTIEESVVMAMDGKDKNLYSYLPYILQDIWEFGASPEIIINLIKKHKSDFENLKILDIGSGKGAVSIKIAKEFKCKCFGIDAVKEFVDESIIKAKEYNVEKYCTFEVGDVRTKFIDKYKYDIIILGAIGPVFGDYYSTLTKIKNCLLPDGLIIVDDSYINESSNFSHSQTEKKSYIINQITNAKMGIIDEVIISEEQIKESNINIFNKIKTRCEELI